MKTKIIFCMLFASLSWSGFAQETTTTTTNYREKKPKFWIGPKFGLDLSPVTYDFNEIKTQLKLNYQAGILMQFGRTLYIQPEAYYASYKSEMEDTISMNSIKVPLMLGLRFLNLGLFSLHAMGGPVFNFTLDGSDSFTGNRTLSWQVGAGIDVLGFITTDVRYTLRKDVALADQLSQFKMDTGSLNVTVGLKLR